MVEASMAIMAACLVLCFLVLAGVCATLTVLIWKRLPQPDAVVAGDLAERLTAAWNAGAQTRKNMDREAEDNVLLEIETRRHRQQWKPDPGEPQPAGLSREDIELGTYGETPMIPEMQKLL